MSKRGVMAYARSSVLIAMALLILALTILACGPLAPEPTATPYPTYTPYPTDTPEPTATATPTSTPTPTLTPTATPTQAPEPVFYEPRFYLTYRGMWGTPGLTVEVDQYPSGIYEIHVEFEYEDVPEMEEIVAGWYHDGSLEDELDSVLSEGDGFIHSWLHNDGGLPDGSYEYRVYYEDRVVQHATSKVGWSPTVWPLAFVDEDYVYWDSLDLPENPKTEFPAGTAEVSHVAWVANLSYGTVIATEWFVDGDFWSQSESTWVHDSHDGWIAGRMREKDGGALPSGRWEVKIYLDGELVRVGDFTIR